MTRKKIYLAGPMRGITGYNFPLFFQYARTLRLQENDVFNPAERDIEHGLNPYAPLDDQNFCLHETMKFDLQQVLWADAIYMLPGWQDSAGARLERDVAVAIGLEVLGYDA